MAPQKKTVVLCGPSRNAESGVATHLNQIFSSALAEEYTLVHFQVGSEGRNEGAAAKLIRILISPFVLMLIILRFKPDIIHLNSSLFRKAYWRDLAYIFVAKIFGCRIVWQMHGGRPLNLFLGTNPLSHLFFRWSLNLPNALVLLAEIERSMFKPFRTGKSVTVIPNAIDLDDYATAVPKKYDERLFNLGYVGRLVEKKGVMKTIEALAILDQGGLDCLRLDIAGTGPYEAELRRKVRDLKLSAVVKFIGPVFDEAKIRFWSDIGIFVFPTYGEGLPFSVLEAMASGTPVIATKVGGIPDVITQGVEGLLIDSREPQSVANAIEDIVSDCKRLEAMSEAAIDRARENYGVERLAKQFDSLYRRVLS